MRLLVLCGVALVLIATETVDACTGFCARGNGQVLVGNNEDYNRPRTKLRFVTAKSGEFGRMYVGFDDLHPQGGMNERGLWFDGFATPRVTVLTTGLPPFRGNIVDRAMATCSSVEEVVRLFSQYNREFLAEGVLMFADASGDAVSIEANAIVRKTKEHFVQTNFHQSQPDAAAGDRRFRTATSMLEQAGSNVSVDLFRTILSQTAQKGSFPTLYSNVYELTSRTMHLYYFRDFDRVVTFRLDDELRKGDRVIDIPSLFPRNQAADAYAARIQPDASPSAVPFMAAVVVTFVLLLGAGAYAIVRGGWRGRITVAAVVVLILVSVAATGLVLERDSQAVPGWLAFSIGPASGKSVSIGSHSIRADGVALKALIATAYGFPASRVVGPPWLAETRYAITAIAPETTDVFRSMLQTEIANRFGLAVQRKTIPFDVFVLAASDPSRLTSVDGTRVRIWVHDSGIDMQEGTLAGLAGALQGVLGKPVIDDTGLTGNYDLDFEWTEDKVGSITAALRHVGLELTPARRDLETLVIQDIQQQPSIRLLDSVSALMRSAPPFVRQHVGDVMRVR